ncbi:MAG: hypothetical protein U0935_19160 [Pirellulales bacterium]
MSRGSVVEWLGGEGGTGAGTCAWGTVRQACRAGGWLVVVAGRRCLCPLPWVAGGIDLRRVVVVSVERVEEELWAADQALRCPGVAAVWGRMERLTAHDFRRLKLAAEEGGSVGVWRRSARHLGRPSWADVQWWVQPIASSTQESSAEVLAPSVRSEERRLRVTLVRCRGGWGGRTVEVVGNERTGELRGWEASARSSRDDRVIAGAGDREIRPVSPPGRTRPGE